MIDNAFFERVAFGNYGGISPLRLNGINGVVSSSYETVWDESTAYSFLAANISAPTISSASAADAAAGTGARTVRVTGVNVDFESVTEIATMNGTTGVTLASS